MQIVVIVFCTVMCSLGYFLEPQKINPFTVFFGEWAIITFLAYLNLYSILQAKDTTYLIILIGCVFYAIGFGIGNYKKYKYRLYFGKNRKGEYDYKLNKFVVYFFIVITLLFFIYDSINAVLLLIQGNTLAFIRRQAQEGVQYTNAFLNAFRIVIATPFSLALMPIMANEVLKKRKDKFIIISAVIICLLRVLADGGRTIFIVFGLSFILCFFYQHKRIPLKKQSNKNARGKRRLIFYLVVILGGIFLWKVSLSRSGENTTRFTYYYFSMEPIMLEKWCAIVREKNILGYGVASFNGFLFPIFYVMKNLFGIPYPSHWRSVYDVIEGIGTNWQIITSAGLTANSYVSVFWTFYADARMYGVVVGMFLYGIYMSNMYKKTIRNYNEKDMMLYCIIMFGIFYSFQFMMFENIYIALTYIWLKFVLYKKVKV